MPIFPHNFSDKKGWKVVYRIQSPDSRTTHRLDRSFHAKVADVKRVKQTCGAEPKFLEAVAGHVTDWSAPTPFISTSANQLWVIWYIALQLYKNPGRRYQVVVCHIPIDAEPIPMPDDNFLYRRARVTPGTGFSAANLLHWGNMDPLALGALRSSGFSEAIQTAYNFATAADEIMVWSEIPAERTGPVYQFHLQVSSHAISMPAPGRYPNIAAAEEGQQGFSAAVDFPDSLWARGTKASTLPWIERLCRPPGPYGALSNSFRAFTLAREKRAAELWKAGGSGDQITDSASGEDEDLEHEDDDDSHSSLEDAFAGLALTS